MSFEDYLLHNCECCALVVAYCDLLFKIVILNDAVKQLTPENFGEG